MAVETHHEPHGYWEQRGLALLWFAILIGPVAVVINQLGGYALDKWVCATDHRSVLLLVSLVSFALALSGTWAGWSCRAQLRDATEDGGRIVDRSYFVAVVAVGLGLLNALLIILQTYPRVVLSPCE